jgi:hypothetical protein
MEMDAGDTASEAQGKAGSRSVKVSCFDDIVNMTRYCPDPQLSKCADSKRCAGVVERIADGVWKVPPGLLQKARPHDAQKFSGLAIELRPHLSIDQQLRAIGLILRSCIA